MKSNTCTKRQWLTIQQKCDIIDEHERCPVLTLAQLAHWALQTLKLSHPPADATIFRMLRDAATIRKKPQFAVTPKGRALRVRCPELEEQLAAFIISCQRQYACL
ncbi:hypothetical protein PR003_g7198 [Phytophthora rubi]|uniref:Uncharacterized protein n=1 Tax=Phytophthora rubi TaxID=129364 RepID=A0A6A4FQ65_9STRA|nr:hypothetical protein PR001_g6716 [Phytophthora rubi]KAE9346918.1 hypothetical protein PR003_g7198 [Phytophthora rubi]